MVSDFFYPNMGGVESHLYCLSQRLLQRGHKVIIVTHAYGSRAGIRYLTNGLKVYYIPHPVVYAQATVPTVFTLLPIMRQVLLRERVDIVHAHQAFSTMALEIILHARTMGIRTCFTDHSLFGFADVSSIVTNKLLKFVLSDIDHVICVSHTSKENTVLRAALDPRQVSVIPNAVVATQFTPDPSAADPHAITIVVISRLVYRKGMDLLAAIIPKICARDPAVRFVIAGDGPKRIDLEQMREKHVLQDRVELLGPVKHSEVLVRGNIFLNTSLTEAFCIGIVEAACCGYAWMDGVGYFAASSHSRPSQMTKSLLVVSTRVGGVPEVLPEHMILFGKPEEDDLVETVYRAIEKARANAIYPHRYHQEVRQMYSWANVAERTEKVYESAMGMATPSLMDRLKLYYGCGVWAGKLFCLMVTVNFLFLCLLEWWFPAADIDQCPEFDRELYAEIVGGRGGSGAKNGQREGARRERYDHEPEPGERGDIEQTSAAETVLTDGVRNGLSTP